MGTASPVSTTQQAAPQATIAVFKDPDPGKLVPWLPCTLALEVSVVGFTVGSLLKLTKGSLVQTSCHQSTDIPLHVNGILMAWTEFEVVGERLAARITDLV
ncbi:FliM/FliN family flagellar motor switch protein [Granulicella tundricola]|uniref:Surface presentation of antigens (SPOA) protein n=1 Tax=Granulicella tundricola (strain ATCC BAA-1859 / DSM 23138 / MP5ACTX9) TaxID=1198114 RepID=E8X634_GRATM|nr:FliM/FliN family flagellar motor C-terminal domain-containing protein [Granulicella tundricola]ADW70918.1 surface presentation of antigens (SPOA) protein [Granulicella tundricola MP5ACTX9]